MAVVLLVGAVVAVFDGFAVSTTVVLMLEAVAAAAELSSNMSVLLLLSIELVMTTGNDLCYRKM